MLSGVDSDRSLLGNLSNDLKESLVMCNMHG